MTARSLAVLIATLGLTPAAALAGGDQLNAANTARTRSGMTDSASGELFYVDVSSDGDRSRGAIALCLAGNGGAADYRRPEPIPTIRWTARGEWRRHRSVAPTGSVVIPLT